MKISVIIPIGGKDDKNRIPNFKETIEFLNKQTYKELEIVVIEQELTEDRETYYNNINVNKYLSIRSQIYPDKFNYAWCSNVGARKASGDLLMFFAGDLLLDKDYIAKVVEYYKENKPNFFMPWSRIYRMNLSGYEYWKKNKQMDDTLRSKENLFGAGPYDYLFPQREGAAGGPVMHKKYFFETFCGYNESFFGWGCEDNEALWRLEYLNNGEIPVMDRWMYHLPHSKKSLDANINRNRYIEYIKNMEQTVSNIKERKDVMGDAIGPVYIPIPNKPTIFYFNWNVGSGIERTGNTILSCIEDRYPIVYKAQNPPCILAKELARQKPEIILINENYPRVFEAVYHYKSYYPKTKIIYFNHCYDFLENLPFKDDYDIARLHRDGTVLVNYLFLNNSMINNIINLNHKPLNVKYHDNISRIVTERYHPIEDKFTLTIPFKDRIKDFFYYGNILPHKFSLQFANMLKQTKINIDIYSDPKKTSDTEYIEKLIKIDNLKWIGRIPEERLVDTLNEYRFFVCPHEGDEPFNLAIAEAIRCGCVPLITNDRSKKGADWIDWAEGCYIEYNHPIEMIQEMNRYLTRKNDKQLIDQIDKASNMASEKMIYLTSKPKFKELLSQLLDK